MSLTDNGGGRGVKTLGIRLEPDRHAQLALIAQVRGSTLNDELQAAIAQHIDTAAADPQFATKANAALSDIEREAEARRQAITSLIGQSTTAPPDGTNDQGKASGPTLTSVPGGKARPRSGGVPTT